MAEFYCTNLWLLAGTVSGKLLKRIYKFILLEN